MRESEMRQRIEGFLKRRMQGMLAPALGLGLAVAGCGESVSVYMGQLPSDAADVTHDTPGSSDSIAPDSPTADVLAAKDTADGLAAKDSTFLGPDTALDVASSTDVNVLEDLAKIVDLAKIDESQAPDVNKDTSPEAGAGVDAGTGVDAGADLGNGGTKYMAQLPDAGRDLGIAPVYIAPLPVV
jgi:hypothetical protein